MPRKTSVLRHTQVRRSGSLLSLLAGAATLVVALASTGAHAANYCAHTSAELIADLTDVSTGGIADGHDNTILLAAGTFTTSGAPFTFKSASGFAFMLEGGYNSTCTTQSSVPGTTVLDGGGATQVINLQTNGTILLSHVTIQHASYNGSAGAGGQVNLTDPAAVLVFEANQVLDNTTTYSVGGLTVFGTSGTATLQNNLFAGNSAPTAAAFSTALQSGTVYITNNTIAANTNTLSNSMIATIGGAGVTAHVSNNVSYGNLGSGTYDFYLSGFENVEFIHNDYGSITGAPALSSSGNLIGIDPKFVGGGDYNLQATSPLLRAGTTSPPGGLAANDLDGNPRSIGGYVDIGAFENIDVIFANGFQTP